MSSSSKSKIIITGTGRAGTTFLVRLLTELGLDTGYTRENWRRDYDVHCAAGLEHDLVDENAPHIIKNPGLCETLPGLLARGACSIEHAIIPIRALDEAVSSRVRVGGDGKTPGGLMGANDATSQKAMLGENFHRLMHTLAAHDIPHTFLEFPRFARDPHYTWKKLHPLFETIEFKDFIAAFDKISDPGLIHDFKSGASVDTGEPTRQYIRRRRRQRWRRQLKRTSLYLLLFAAGWKFGVFWTAG